MSYFRQRIWLDPPNNIPQMMSGTYIYSIVSIFIYPPTLTLDSEIPAISVGTTNVFDAQYTATPPTLDLATEIPTISVSAHSP